MPSTASTADLARLPLFDGLSPSEQAAVDAALHAARFAAGAAILTAEQPGEVAYLVVSGTLKVSLLQASGAEAILAILGPGEVVGELSLVDRGGRSADVVALEPSVLRWIDRGSYLALRASIPRLSDNLVGLLARRLRLANSQILGLATLDVPGRVARQLLALAEVYGVPATDGRGVTIDIRLTQGDLAALCGATRARVNQVLMGFKERGFIADAPRHRLTLLNARALEEYCG